MELLLKKIGVLNYSYKKKEKRYRFNIFPLLLKRDDEVNLHSKFIFELLNPKGSHEMKNSFLNAFLVKIGLSDFRTENVTVRREYRNIDILITNSNQAIIIENKIYAEDKDKQLERYYQTIKKMSFKDIWIVYLSLGGSEPEKYSLGDLGSKINLDEKLKVISYSFDINDWLEDCIEKSARTPIIRETIIQYQNLVKELTGKTMEIEQRKELLELLGKGDNMMNAYQIASNWNHIRWHTEDYFWTGLAKIIEKEYDILDIQKYSHDKLTNVIHHKRSRNPWFGYIFSIGRYKDYKVCLAIERSFSELYYGITLVKGNLRNYCKNEDCKDLAQEMKGICTWESDNEFWFGGRMFEPHINFESFSDETTLHLANEPFRKKYIQNQWKEIKVFIEEVKKILK